MADAIAKGYVEIVADKGSFDKSLGGLGDGDTGSKVGAGIGKKIAAGLAAVSAVGVGAIVADFASGSIEAATNLGESINAVNKIFGDSSKEILDWGKNNATQFGLSQAAFNSLATPLGALLKNSGLEDVAGQTVDLTKRAADLASVFNVDVSEAMEAINSGLKGEADPLEKFGIGLSAAKVEAQALADTGKTLGKELTDQEKAQARINLIMKESNSVAGDFTATSGEFANAQRISAARTEELQAKLGVKLIPIMQKVNEIKFALVSIIVDKLLPAFDAVSSFVTGTLVPAFQSVFGFLADNEAILIGVAVAIAVPLVGAFIAWAASAAAAAAATIAATLPVIAIGVAIAALVAGVIYAYQNWDFFRTAVDKVADVLQAFWSNVLRPVGEWIIGSLVPWIRDNLIPTFVAIGAGIADVIADVAGFFGDVKAKFDDVVGFITGLPERIANAASGMWDGIKNAFKSAMNFIIDGWNGLEFKIPGFDPPGPGPKFSGFTLGVPDLPRFEQGGYVNAPRGVEVPAIVHGGEYVIRADGSNAPGGMTVNFNGRVDRPRDVLTELSWAMATRGGRV